MLVAPVGPGGRPKRRKRLAGWPGRAPAVSTVELWRPGRRRARARRFSEEFSAETAENAEGAMPATQGRSKMKPQRPRRSQRKNLSKKQVVLCVQCRGKGTAGRRERVPPKAGLVVRAPAYLPGQAGPACFSKSREAGETPAPQGGPRSRCTSGWPSRADATERVPPAKAEPARPGGGERRKFRRFSS